MNVDGPCELLREGCSAVSEERIDEVGIHRMHPARGTEYEVVLSLLDSWQSVSADFLPPYGFGYLEVTVGDVVLRVWPRGNVRPLEHVQQRLVEFAPRRCTGVLVGFY